MYLDYTSPAPKYVPSLERMLTRRNIANPPGYAVSSRDKDVKVRPSGPDAGALGKDHPVEYGDGDAEDGSGFL